MTFYAENVHEFSKQTIRTNIQGGKVVGYKIKSQKKQLCFSSQARNDPKKEKKKIKEKIRFISYPKGKNTKGCIEQEKYKTFKMKTIRYC